MALGVFGAGVSALGGALLTPQGRKAVFEGGKRLLNTKFAQDALKRLRARNARSQQQRPNVSELGQELGLTGRRGSAARDISVSPVRTKTGKVNTGATNARRTAEIQRKQRERAANIAAENAPVSSPGAVRNLANRANLGVASATTGLGATVPFVTSGVGQTEQTVNDVRNITAGGGTTPNRRTFDVPTPEGGSVSIPNDAFVPEPITPIEGDADAERVFGGAGSEEDGIPGLDPQFDLPPSTPAAPPQGVQAAAPTGSQDPTFQVPEGQQLFDRVQNESGGFGEVFASPDAIERARAGGGGGVTTVSAGEIGGDAFRQRELLRVNEELQARIANESDPDARAELRDQALGLFEKFEQGKADRATAERLGISEAQARTLRGDFGKQPTQQGIPQQQRSRFDPGGGGFTFGQPQGPRVIDSQLGIISQEQANEVAQQRQAENLQRQQGVQAIVDANQQQRELEAEQAAAGQPTRAEEFQREKFEEQKRRTAAAEAETARKAARQTVLDAAPTREEGQRRLAETIETQRRGLNISADAVRRLREGAQAGDRGRLAESGFVDDFAEGGIGGAISNLLNSIDFGEGISQALGIEEGPQPTPRNAQESIAQLEELNRRYNGPDRDLEIGHLPKKDAEKLQEAFDMLPEMKALAAEQQPAPPEGVQPAAAGNNNPAGATVPRKFMSPSSAAREFSRTGQVAEGFTAEELQKLLREQPGITAEDF